MSNINYAFSCEVQEIVIKEFFSESQLVPVPICNMLVLLKCLK